MDFIDFPPHCRDKKKATVFVAGEYNRVFSPQAEYRTRYRRVHSS